MAMIRGRLINVSNRLPIQVRKHGGGARVSRSSGGLTTALDAVWRNQPGVWIGWPGPAQGVQLEPIIAKAAKDKLHTFRAVVLSEDEVAKFYAGFANEIVWPLFHDMPTQCNFDPDYWETYERVNRKFAMAIAETAKPGDFVWVHDYHLMLVAGYLRELNIKEPVGFFLHIPFPSPDVFEKLPWREPVLRSMLDYDLVGFQTERDCNNFVTCIERILPEVSISRKETRVVFNSGRRNAIAGTFPISIDYEEFANHAARPEMAARAEEIRKDLNDTVLVLGVDRMDYTKGIPERLKAYRIVLQRYPELRRRVTLVQVVVPSREDIPNYKDLRREVELLVSQINGEYTQPGWVPIHYMHRNLGRDDLVAYYRAADVALVTPLKDGMNLVAKEFCAAQIDERGVIIVSEFAGAGPELQKGAILVNPNDLAGVAQAIHDACLMPREEKRQRMHTLREIVKDHNVRRWARSFMQAALPLIAGDQEIQKAESQEQKRDDAGEAPHKLIATPLTGPDSIQEFPGRYRLWSARAND